MRFLPVSTMMAAGACVAIQGPVNAHLRLAVGSYAIDAFGLFGVEKVPFSWVRLGGLGLLALGVLLVQRK